ncbi:phosphatase PAP2 family protein [Streptomyces sp. SBT349]|uniref:phosphatase PAP2 family protein n=1 Tax=Streptomyces sp. SBT349 TaxID=1580539 RepID=UPI00099BF2AC|nr:phosphatase PAP2 family protein [Streptomyces sp. SBT349]
MTEETRQGQGLRRLGGALAILAAGLVALALLWPGGLGHPEPLPVTSGASVELYRTLTDAVAGAPEWLAVISEGATEGGLVALGLLLLWLGWGGLRHGEPREVAGVLLTGLATVAAYAGSEALKLVADQERPCRAVPGADALAACPPPGDWAFPSNHATLAVALATGLIWLRPRVAVLALPLAVATAVLRVVVGLHYPHDVLAGAALGAAVTAAVLLALLPLVGAVAAPRLARFAAR